MASGRSAVPAKKGEVVAAVLEEEYDAAPPEEFLCPINQTLMKDPVVNGKGHTYERVAILRSYLKRYYNEDTSFQSLVRDPITNTYLTPAEEKILVPNFAIKSQIDEWKKKHRKAPPLAVETKPVAVPPVERKPTPSAPPSVPAATSAPAPVLPATAPTVYVPQLIARARPPASSTHAFLSALAAERKYPAPWEDKDVPPAVLFEDDLGAGDLSEGEAMDVDAALIELSPSDIITPAIRNFGFLTAVRENRIADVREHLREGANVNAQQDGPGSGDTALIIAVKNGNKEMVQFLCDEAKAEVNTPNGEGDVALFFAFNQEENWFTDFLLRKGAYTFSSKHDDVALYYIGRERYGASLWTAMTSIAIAEGRSRRESFAAVPAAPSVPPLDASEMAWRNSLRR